MEKITVLGHGHRRLARLNISVIILSLSTISGFGVWHRGRLFRSIKNTNQIELCFWSTHTKGLQCFLFILLKVYNVLRGKKGEGTLDRMI